MRADFERFLKAYRQPPPPSEIRQEPFEFNPRHLKRLCALNDSMPDPSDVYDYTEDLRYVETTQPDLFAHLLPICLRAWQHDLFHCYRSQYAGFVEQFTAALADRWTDFRTLLKPVQSEAVTAFMRDSILDMIDRETNLSHRGSLATPYAWTEGLGSFAVIFPDLKSLWRIWWRFETPGQAIAALQYASAFMYEEDRNPVFAPWTPDGGGGPLCPWETDGVIYDQSWQAENVAFFKSTVTPDFIRNALVRAAKLLNGIIDSDVPSKMLADFEQRRPLLEHRLRVFSDIVSRPLREAPIAWPPFE